MTNPFSIKQVLIKISDPWNLGVHLNWQALQASIIAGNDSAVLLQLDSPFVFDGTACEYFVASPRHEGDHMSELQKDKSVFCGMTRISSEQAKSSNPMDLSRWRGGLAIIGELEPVIGEGNRGHSAEDIE